MALIPCSQHRKSTRWCDQNESLNIQCVDSIHPDIVGVVNSICYDLVEYLVESVIGTQSFERCLTSFVFPLFSTLSLIDLEKDSRYDLLDKMIMLIKRIELLRMSIPVVNSLEFLECLLCHFVNSRKPVLSLNCSLDAIQNGWNTVELNTFLRVNQMDRLMKDGSTDTQEIAFLNEFMQGTSPRMIHFFSLFEQRSTVPSMIRHKYPREWVEFCRLSLAFHIHNLSLSSL